MKSCFRPIGPLVALIVLSGFAVPAFAQQYPGYYGYGERPVQGFIQGGASVTEGDAAADFDNGFTFGGGVNILPQPGVPFGLRLEANYARSDATNAFINANQAATGTSIDQGSMQTITGFADAVMRTPINPYVHIYGLAGVGVGYRRIELTQNGFLCDVFFCGVGGGHVVGSSEVTKFAWNAGAGIDFAMPGGRSWFVEARYERIETDTPTEFIPIRVGMRF
ncbi:MAG TPA: outer membrane beta-barrel protein [Steroidobacteraceae bacterium]|nr:outer membrane beta-barrel protein [Steroidobacteraceae bacterium]